MNSALDIQKGRAVVERSQDLFEKLQAAGESGIEELIEARASEEYFLDFKRSADGGAGNRLSDNDRNNLAKAISGFGNSEGGVVVWGVDCSADPSGADVAKAKFPLEDAQRFRSWLEGAVSGRTSPPHQGVEHCTILVGDGPSGFVVTHIPQSNSAPHQVVGKLHYYIRVGSSFVPAPHGVLAGMFGRRPQPKVYHNFAVPPAVCSAGKMNLKIGFMIHNEGPGVAEDVFANIQVNRLYGDNCTVKFEGPDPADWRASWSFGRHLSLISRGDLKLPPGGFLQPVIMNIVIGPPFERDLNITGLVGASSSPPFEILIRNSRELGESVFQEFEGRQVGQPIPAADGSRFTSRILGGLVSSNDDV